MISKPGVWEAGMEVHGRRYSEYADSESRAELTKLLEVRSSPRDYQDSMTVLGRLLGKRVNSLLPKDEICGVVSTAEDADFLSNGVIEAISPSHSVKAAVFWNNHYKSLVGVTVAPVVHKYVQPGFEESQNLVVVKSVMSGSCVVRTNIMELISKLDVRKIYVVAPVMHADSQEALIKEFPRDIADKFEFIYLAIDDERESSGEVKPGIGGQVYSLLGLGEQPARTGFMPNLVRRLVAL